MQSDLYIDNEIEIFVKPHSFSDRFQINFDSINQKIRIQRLDYNGGWGQDLYLGVIDKINNKTNILRIGASSTNVVYRPLNKNENHNLKTQNNINYNTNYNIPQNIYLCYKNKDIPSSIFDNISRLNPNYKINLYDDNECRIFLGDELGGIYADCFDFIPDGAIRADFWRSAIIFKRGGVYFDIDVEHIMGIDQYLYHDTTFLVSTAWNDAVNPIVLIAKPNNDMLKLSTEWYISAFQQKNAYSYWGWSICYILKNILNNNLNISINNNLKFIHHNNDLYQFVNENKSSRSALGFYTHFGGLRILYNHRPEYVGNEQSQRMFHPFFIKNNNFVNNKYSYQICNNNYLDRFHIDIFNNYLLATRLDMNCGWGQDLNIIITEVSSGLQKLINIGSSSFVSKKINICIDDIFNKDSIDPYNIIDILKVYNLSSSKLRLGNNKDGGYIINDNILLKTDRLISLGVGNEDSFERHFITLKPASVIECYDGSCKCGLLCQENTNIINKNIYYINQHVGNILNYITLDTIIGKKNNILLKIDIEGGEYNLFDNVDLSGVTGIILEVHDLQNIDNRNKLVNILENYLKDFIIFHIHGNNYGGTFPLECNNTIIEQFPKVLEISLCRRDICEIIGVDRSHFPINGLDAPNNNGIADIDLSWINN